jgi:hypothetical protein
MNRNALNARKSYRNGFFILLAMIIMATSVDYVFHIAFRSWLIHTFTPLMLGGCSGFTLIYFVNNQRRKSSHLNKI